MGRDLQKKKKRSSRSTIRQPSSRKSAKLLNPLGNSIIARNWNKDETTTENYKRLGLVGRLQAPTGGVAPDLKSKSATGKFAKPVDPFAINPNGTVDVVSEARVERDEKGNIVRVIGNSTKPNPLNDPLNDLDSDSEDDGMQDDGETWGGIADGRKKGKKKGGQEEVDDRTEVFKALEAEANRPREKKIRTTSQREREWLQSLVDRYGDDTKAMARDHKLNPMQQTASDISRRLKKMRSEA